MTNAAEPSKNLFNPAPTRSLQVRPCLQRLIRQVIGLQKSRLPGYSDAHLLVPNRDYKLKKIYRLLIDRLVKAKRGSLRFAFVTIARI